MSEDSQSVEGFKGEESLISYVYILYKCWEMMGEKTQFIGLRHFKTCVGENAEMLLHRTYRFVGTACDCQSRLD